MSQPDADKTPPALRLRGLTRYFGTVCAADHIDLDVAEGEVVALVGPSGCGKTTTLRLIAGFELPNGGEIEIRGNRVAGPGTQTPPEQRRVGMVFQNYALFPHLSVGDNVGFGLNQSNRSTRESRVATVLKMVGLTGFQSRMPHELSGGQQQRVAIARALAPNPAILLLDEPFSNLDASRRTQMREDVRDILKKNNITAVFVTHSQEEAMFMGDRIAILNLGQLEQQGQPEYVYHRPASRFVAEFLGESGFLPGTVNGELVDTMLGPVQAVGSYAQGTPVDVLMRPDNIMIRPVSAEHANATALSRYFRGAYTLYHIRLDDGSRLQSFRLYGPRISPGTPVQARIAAKHPLTVFVRDA